MAVLFFQTFWHIIGNDVVLLIINVLNNGLDLLYINNPHIILIPKCKNPTTTSEFIPISICNFFLKIITKTITNKLKKNSTYYYSLLSKYFCSWKTYY